MCRRCTRATPIYFYDGISSRRMFVEICYRAIIDSTSNSRRIKYRCTLLFHAFLRVVSRSLWEKLVLAVTNVVSFNVILQSARRMHQLIQHSLFFPGSQTFIATARVIFSVRETRVSRRTDGQALYVDPQSDCAFVIRSRISLGHCR